MSRGRGRRPARLGLIRDNPDGSSDVVESWKATQPTPMRRKAKSRAQAKRARQSRKRNR